MGLGTTGRWLAGLVIGATVLGAGVVLALGQDLGALRPTTDEAVRHGQGAVLLPRPAPRGPAGPTAVERRVLREVPGAHRSGDSVVVPVRLGPGNDGAHEVLRADELLGAVVAVDAHAYTEPWDWTGVRGPVPAALRTPARGRVVGDLGPAFLACHVRYREQLSRAEPCLMVTVVRDDRGRWRVVERWAGRARWPYGPHSALEVRVASDLPGPAPAYLVTGAVAGRASAVRVRARSGALAEATLDVQRVSPVLTTFWVLLPELPQEVTTYDERGRVGQRWRG